MYTRQDYLNNKCSHSEYYAQYVDNYVKRLVFQTFSINALKEAGEHFNGISLDEWTLLAGWLKLYPSIHILMKERGDYWSGPAQGVCILKEAARQLLEGEQE